MACEFSACHFGAPRIWAHISASAGGVPTPYRRVRIFSEMEGSLLAPSQSPIILFDRIRDEHCVIVRSYQRFICAYSQFPTEYQQYLNSQIVICYIASQHAPSLQLFEVIGYDGILNFRITQYFLLFALWNWLSRWCHSDRNVTKYSCACWIH